MNKTILKILFAIVFSSLIITGCDKNETRPNPNMSFVTDQGYTYQDASFVSGDTLWVGLNCKWNGTDLLKTITLYANDVQISSYSINEATGQELQLTVTLTKSQSDNEKWDFELADANGQKTVLSLTLTKDQSGTAIESISGIKLGAQDNTTIGGFYALSNREIYSETEAFDHQTIIDMVCGYDNDNKTFLASPGANLDGVYDLSAWTAPLNTTNYCATDITTLQFDLIETDALIIEAFDVDNQKGKAKELSVDDIYVFKTQSGKYGIFKVTAVEAGTDGSFTFDIKVQP